MGLGSRAGQAAWAAAEVGHLQAQLPPSLCSKSSGKDLQHFGRGLPPSWALGGHRTPLAVGERGRPRADRSQSGDQVPGIWARASGQEDLVTFVY